MPSDGYHRESSSRTEGSPNKISPLEQLLTPDNGYYEVCADVLPELGGAWTTSTSAMITMAGHTFS